MKTFLALAFSLAVLKLAAADVKISALPETNAAAVTAVFPLVDAGVTWKVQKGLFLSGLTNWAKITTNILSGGDSTWTNGFERVYNVKLFGATGNGSTDDTAAIQSAVDACDGGPGGTVYFPNGTYKLVGTTNAIILGRTNGVQHFVSLRGESEVNTVLNYAGPTNGTAIVLNSDKYSSIENLSVTRSLARGTTIGILLTGAGSGTQSNGGYIRNVLMDGFSLGIDGGPESPYTGTSSEWIFDNVSFNNLDKGFSNHDFNGLNYFFRMVQAYNVTRVIEGATAGISIDGGSFTSVGTGFYCRNGGLFAIRNVRSEVETGPFVDSASTVLIENCLANFTDTNSPAISISGGNATIKMCQLGAYIDSTGSQSLDVEDCGLNAQSVATISGNHGQLTYLRNYQTVGQTSAKLAMFPDSLQVAGQSPSRAAAFDASTNLVSATPTLTELNLLSGVTNPIHSGAVGDGLTNSAGAIKLALATGSNISFNTNNGQITISSTGSGSVPTGTVVNTGDSTANAIPNYLDTSGTNIGPSTVRILSGVITNASGLSLDAAAVLLFGSDARLVREAANRLALTNGTSGNGMRFYGDTNNYASISHDGTRAILSASKLSGGAFTDVALSAGGSVRWSVSAASGDLLPFNNDSHSVGAPSSRVKGIYIGTLGTQSGVTKLLTSAASSTLFYIAVPNTNTIGGSIIYTVSSTDGTEAQEITGETKFGAVAKATTVTAQVTDSQTTAAVSSGTLTATLAANVTTNNVFALGVTATTSLTTTNLVIKWRIETPSTFTVNAL